MNRQDKILNRCQKKGKGLEIGPSFNPVAPKSDGYDVEVLDYTTDDELRKKYAGLGVDISKIEPVDFVWSGEPIDELIGQAARYDWIIASHVVEHLPDLISFLRGCSTLLKPEGVLSLAVPDKRFCFDCFRWPSSTGDVWQAWIEKRKKHTPAAIFDHNAYGCKKGKKHAWDKAHNGEVRFIHDFSLISKTFESYKDIKGYVDIHTWRFTPSSFRLIILELRQLGLIDLAEAAFHDTEGCEFFVSLEHCSQDDVDIQKERLALCEQAIREVSEQITPSKSAEPINKPSVGRKAFRYLKKHGIKKTLSRSFLELRVRTGNTGIEPIDNTVNISAVERDK